jgi:hypothetical protein
MRISAWLYGLAVPISSRRRPSGPQHRRSVVWPPHQRPSPGEASSVTQISSEHAYSQFFSSLPG